MLKKKKIYQREEVEFNNELSKFEQEYLNDYFINSNCSCSEKLLFKKELFKLHESSNAYANFEGISGQYKVKSTLLDFIRDYSDYLPESERNLIRERAMHIPKVPQDDIKNVYSY